MHPYSYIIKNTIFSNCIMKPFTPHHLQTNLLPNNKSNKNLNAVNASSLKESTGDSQSSFAISKEVARRTSSTKNATLKKRNGLSRDLSKETEQSRSVDFISYPDSQLSNAKMKYGNSHDQSQTSRISRMSKSTVGSYVPPVPNYIWNINASSSNITIDVEFLSTQISNSYMIYYTYLKTNKKIQIFPTITYTNTNDYYLNTFSITNLHPYSIYEISITTILNAEFNTEKSRWKPMNIILNISTQEGYAITDLSLNPSYDKIYVSFTPPLYGDGGYIVYLNNQEQQNILIEIPIIKLVSKH